MISVQTLSKSFNGNKVVNDVSLQVENGNIFGLLGPNASGKTTTIRMLCGIIPKDSGDILINGVSSHEAKSDFGYVAQYFGQYEELSVWENLSFYASIYGVKDDAHLLSLLERYDLLKFKKQFAGSLSGGYKRRLALACALAHDPKVLFLDEPTAGIDPVTRKLLWDDFYQLSAEGKTLFVTTHYMEEAQRCHQLAFISEGHIVAEGTPETIKDALKDARVFTAKIPYRPDLHKALYELSNTILVNQFGDQVRIVVNSHTLADDLNKQIQSITGLETQVVEDEANLEDVFIALTQEKIS